MPDPDPAEVEQRIVELRTRERRGPDWIGAELGVPARTVSRVLARHQVAAAGALDPITGQVIRATKVTAVPYERDRPGELVHMDVKKLGKIPDGGGWRAHGRAADQPPEPAARPGSATTTSTPWSTTTPGWPTPRSCPTRRAPPAPAFLTRAAAYFAAHGITRIERIMTDNAWAYRYSLREVVAAARRPAEVHQAALPLAKRQGRKTQPDPADRMGLPTGLHQQHRTHRRPCPLDRVLQHSTTPQRTRQDSHPSADCYQPT